MTRLLLVLLAPLAAASPAPTGSPSPDAGSDPARLQRIRIVPTTNGPPAQSTNLNSFYWEVGWKGWDGLEVEVTHRNYLWEPMTPFLRNLGVTNHMFHLEQVQMTSHIGVRVAGDGAVFETSGSLRDFDNGGELRRARLYAYGDCVLVVPVSYRIELGYIPNQFQIEESYLAFHHLGVLGTLKLGQYRTPFSLDAYTSTRDIRFMEPAAPVTALAPGVNAGFQVGRSLLGERMTWAMGIFSDGVGHEFGDASQDYGRAVLRVTGLPIRHLTPDEPESQQLLHLGLSVNWLYSASGTVRYRTRPESHLAPYVLDTGELEAQTALTMALESAWSLGPLSIQGEYLAGGVHDRQGRTPIFHGGYAQAGWFLTGENRAYNAREGRLDRVVPLHDFTWQGKGWGALEILGRFSFTDLNDGYVSGGRMALLATGLSWHPNAHVRWAFNFINGKADGPSGTGWINAFQTRLEIDL